MSEYQYYEFQAIDRRLTDQEMSKLRSYSSRARITPTSFTVDYSWGDFKGNADAWMDQYFDAFLYLANWGTHALKLRLPSRLLDMGTARLYCAGQSAKAREKDGNVILSFVSEDEGGGEWVEGEDELASLIAVRADLLRGDHRSLYMAWLLCAQEGDLEDDEVEPSVPPGLAQLSASLDSLADFLRIDEDLTHVAAKASQPLDLAEPKHEEILMWLERLPRVEKDDLLARLIAGGDTALAGELRRRFLHDGKKKDGHPGEEPKGRTVGELLSAAKEYTKERKRLKAEKAAREKARREKEASIKRSNYLDAITGREPELWSKVEGLIAAKQPKSYDAALELLVDLRDLAARKGGMGLFTTRINALRDAYRNRPALIKRLSKLGV